MELQGAFLAFIAVTIQVVVIIFGFGDLAVGRRYLFVLSYLLLFPFVWLNRRQLGIAIIGLGVLLNFAAVATNGGLMPLDPDTVERAGRLDKIADVRLGEPVPHSKDVLLTRDSTRLWFLSDVLTVDNPLRIYAFSAGDVLLFTGLLVTMGSYFLPRRISA